MTHDLDRIRTAVADAGINKKRLAEIAKVHPNSLVGIEKPGWNPKHDTLAKLHLALDRIVAMIES